MSFELINLTPPFVFACVAVAGLAGCSPSAPSPSSVASNRKVRVARHESIPDLLRQPARRPLSVPRSGTDPRVAPL